MVFAVTRILLRNYECIHANAVCSEVNIENKLTDAVPELEYIFFRNFLFVTAKLFFDKNGIQIYNTI